MKIKKKSRFRFTQEIIKEVKQIKNGMHQHISRKHHKCVTEPNKRQCRFIQHQSAQHTPACLSKLINKDKDGKLEA